MAKMSRDKGKRGELEVVAAAGSVGLSARRTAPLQAASAPLKFGDVLIHEFPSLHLEVKRDERMSVDAMVRQAEADAPEGHTPVVAWRRNNRPWRADVPLSAFLDLLAVQSQLADVIAGYDSLTNVRKRAVNVSALIDQLREALDGEPR